MQTDILFLTLKVFSATGGIEKVCRVAGKSMYEYGLQYQKKIRVFCMHDATADAENNQYFPAEYFKGFSAKKALFVAEAVKQGLSSRLVILSHINLLPAAWLIKKLSPSTQIVLMAHGIEIWGRLPKSKEKMLSCVDRVLAVSAYTKNRVINDHRFPKEQCMVINNCLDPFLVTPQNIAIPSTLYERYGIRPGDKIVFTLTRLSSREKYKGYDKVIEAISRLSRPDIKYLLAGKYDAEEKNKIEKQVQALGLQGRVIMAGFIPDDELAAHFMMSDVYVMPSTKEGFGIVFIEAMYYGLPVVAGNEDGSVDALLNGKLGRLVTPSDVNEIMAGIADVLNGDAYRWPEMKLLMEYFGYESYKQQINNLFNQLLNTALLAHAA